MARFLLAGSVSVTLSAHAGTVTNTNDTGPGSLREIIAAAAANETIDFDASLANATIDLTSGPLLIDKALDFDATPLDTAVVPVHDQQVRLNTVGRQEAFLITVDPATVTGRRDFEIEGRPPKPSYGTFLDVSATGGEAGDAFGAAMAQSDNQLLVGAPAEDGAGNAIADSGAAYLFTPEQVNVDVPGGTPIVRRDWLQRTVLRADNAEAGDAFGSAVAIAGRFAVVGAPAEDGAANGTDGSGAAYVFVRDEAGVWTQQAVLRADLPAASAAFGTSVAIKGDRVAVGAPGGETAYLFQRTGTSWAQVAAVAASNGEANDDFGTSVALTPAGLFVGAPSESSDATGIGGDGSNNNAFRAGAVYHFTQDGGGAWTEQHYIKGSTSGGGDNFGFNLAAFGDLLAVGAPFYDANVGGNNFPDCGAVFLFDLSASAPVEEAFLKANNADINDQFGSSIALVAGRLLVGAPREDSAASDFDGDAADNTLSDAGAVYLFENAYGYWRQRSYVKSASPAAGGQFGKGVALSSDTAFAGDGESLRPFDSRTEYTFIRPEVLSRFDLFGQTLGLSGDTLVVGDPGHVPDGVFGPNTGSISIYQRAAAGWRRHQTFLGPGVGGGIIDGGRLGASIAIQGDTLVVGSRDVVTTDPGTGSILAIGGAFIFTRSGGTWTQGPLRFVGGNRGEGQAVALDGDRIAVGTGDEFSSPIPARTFIYTRSGGVWTHTHTLPPHPGHNMDAPLEVADIVISGDKVVVSYLNRDLTQTPPFRSFLQMFDLGSSDPEVAKASLTLPVSLPNAGTGWRLAMEGNLLAAMANGNVRIYRFPVNAFELETTISLPTFGDIREFTGPADLTYGMSLSKAGLAVGTRDGALLYQPRPTPDGITAWDLRRRYGPLHDFVHPENFSYGVVIGDDGTIVASTLEHTLEPADRTGVNPLEEGTFPTDIPPTLHTPNILMSGAAFVFERPGGKIALEDDSGMTLAPGSTLVFTSLEPGVPVTRTFTLRNDSGFALELSCPAIAGADAGQFAITTPPAESVAPGGSTSFTLSFTPGTNPLSSARLQLLTNLADGDLFTVPLSAITVTPGTDTDGDGLDDAFEVRFAALGFDFQVAQPDLVAAYLATAGQVGSGSTVEGLFSRAQLGALRPGAQLISRDPVTGEFTMRLGLGRSTDLLDYDPFPFVEEATSIDAEGRLEFRFTDGIRAFYRIEFDQ